MASPTFPAEYVFLGRGLAEPRFSPDARSLYFVQHDGAASAIVRACLRTGALHTLTTSLEPAAGILYGGGLFDVGQRSLVFGARDGRLHRLDLHTGDRMPVTPSFDAVGAPVLSPCGRFVAFVAEQDRRASVYLAALDGSAIWRLPGCLSFCCDPVFGPDGAYAAFQTWEGDHMPWEHSELRVAVFRTPLAACEHIWDALPARLDVLAIPGTHLAFPLPHPNGTTLFFTSDERGVRAPWMIDLVSHERNPVAQLLGEVGSPNWVQRMMPMAVVQDGSALVVVQRSEGVACLVRVDTTTGRCDRVDTACSSISSIAAARGPDGGDVIAYVGSSPSLPPALFTRLLPGDSEGAAERSETIRVSSAVGCWAPERLAPAQVVRWTSPDGVRLSGILTRIDRVGPGPLVVSVHGGPTSCSELAWDPLAQFLATRGYAMLSVNHRGSTQHGRAFQDMLQGQWGIVDVQDARSGAQALIDRSIADAARVAVLGASAGGYTALMCLCTDPDFWAAGIAMYPVTDLYDAALGTHRFERPYQSWLVGSLPDAARAWRERSPLHLAHRVRAPVLLFHGTDDKAVPCRQSTDFASALARRGAMVQLNTYEGEGHGFRQPSTRRDVLERIHQFLDKYVLHRQGAGALSIHDARPLP
jgi:acetyl esterase/lipase